MHDYVYSQLSLPIERSYTTSGMHMEKIIIPKMKNILSYEEFMRHIGMILFANGSFDLVCF